MQRKSMLMTSKKARDWHADGTVLRDGLTAPSASFGMMRGKAWATRTSSGLDKI